MNSATYKSNLQVILEQIRTDAFDTMRTDANQILGESQANVPIDDGELVSSAVLSEQLDRTKGMFVISYGTGPVSAEYAVIQHENPYYDHHNGSYKFLEHAFDAIAPTVLTHLKDIFT